MKRVKTWLVAIIFIVSALMSMGCYFVNPQTMKDVKGTYELTSYTKRYNNASDGTNVDYITDYGYKIYLVVTGTDRGWYVMQSNETATYAKEVKLTYEYDTEETNKLRYVFYRDSTTDESYKTRLGITKDTLSHNQLHDIFTKPYTINMSFKKVDKAIDLSYVTEQLGEFPTYGYDVYKYSGLYSISSYGQGLGGALVEEYEHPYIYYFYALDAETKRGTAYYALKSDGVQRTEEREITLLDSWNSISFDEITWTEIYDCSFTASIAVEGEIYTAEWSFYKIRSLGWKQEDLETEIRLAMESFEYQQQQEESAND